MSDATLLGLQLVPSSDPSVGPAVSSRSKSQPFHLGLLVNGRFLRLLIGLGLLAAATWYIYLYTFNKVSIAGVVNAPLVTVVSQIDGRIGEEAVAQGAAVISGHTLASVINERVDNRTAVDLTRSLEASRERLSALRASVDELTALRADLARRGRDFQEASIGRLEQTVKELEASLAAARVAERQTSDEQERGAVLFQHATIAQARYDALSYAHQRAEAEVKRVSAALARGRRELAAARSGISLGDNFADVPYSRQRLDEVDIRLASLHNDERGLIASIAELEAKLAAEKERVAKLTQQELTAPVDGVIWRSMITPNAEVIRGAPLFEVIDCSKIYIEATARERFFETLTPGQRVHLSLEGASKDLRGTIRSVVGPGASLDNGPKLSVINRRNGTEAQVIIDIDAGALPASAGATCNVGRSAKVYFE